MSETQQNLRDPRDLQLTVLGLGEAGAIFAAGIAARSGEVRGFDPADVGDPPGVDRCATAAEAVTGAGGVIALTHAGQAMTAEADIDTSGPLPRVRRSGVVWTARKLFDGYVFPRPGGGTAPGRQDGRG